MPVMRRQWIVGLAALVVLFVPIVLAAALKGSHHHTASSGPVVLAREDGNDALALSVTSNAVQVKLFGPQGKGLGGRTVTVAGTATRSCGSGCYVAQTSARGDVAVLVDGRRFSFAFPREAPDATALLQRATTAFRALHSVTYVERLASSTTSTAAWPASSSGRSGGTVPARNGRNPRARCCHNLPRCGVRPSRMLTCSRERRARS